MHRFLIAIAVALALAIFATTPPSPRDFDAPSGAFSASRAMEHVARIAAAPHPTGSREDAAVRRYLAETMRGLGLEVSESRGRISEPALERLNKWSGRSDSAMPLVNVIAVLPGKDRSLPAVLLMSHHDTVWGSPGAADDTAGVAASLEVVRAIKSGGQPRRDLVVLVTDGEELGLEGAKQFFAENPLRRHIGAVINMEARGGGGRTTLFQTSRDNGEAVRLYANAVSRPAASSLADYVYSVLPNDTDLTPAVEGPYAAYNLAFIGRSGLYHSPLATPARLDGGSLQDMGDQVLDLTRALLAVPELPKPSSDVVFFDLFGLMTLVWPTWMGWLMLALALAGLTQAVKREGSAGLVEGSARMLGLLGLSGGLLYAFNWLSIGSGKSEYYDRLAAIPRLEAIAALVCAASFLLVFGAGRYRAAATTGAALPLVLIAIAAQALAPTAAYVLIVPLLISAGALWWPARWPKIGAAALVTGYMLALGHQLMQAVGPTMPFAASVPLGLATIALLGLWPGIPAGRARAVAAGLLACAAAFALWVQLDAPAETRAVYAGTKR